MSGLDAEFLKQLLEEEAQQPKRGGGKRVDPTEDRSYPAWYKLHHHLCLRSCAHRLDPSNLSRPDPASDPSLTNLGHACWNPNCVDPRDKGSDRSGASVVYEVKGQMICRYCYLDNYLA